MKVLINLETRYINGSFLKDLQDFMNKQEDDCEFIYLDINDDGYLLLSELDE